MDITNCIFRKQKVTYAIPEDLYLEQWIVPKGTVITTHETKNFGWVVLPEHTLDKRGFEIPHRIFKY